ncbi:MAG: diguanylate cyclase [Candidatus Wallbacteria bacterium]|nr:diguanylate cyclase [Candidatus Wallbacteria bacterium]
MRKSLGFRIAVLFISIILVPLLLTLHIADRAISRISRDENLRKLELGHTMVTNYLKSKKIEMKVNSKKVSDILSWQELDSQTIENALKEFSFTGMQLISDTAETSWGLPYALPRDIKERLKGLAARQQWQSIDCLFGNSLLMLGVSPLTRRYGESNALICINELKSDFIDPLYELTGMHVELYNGGFTMLAGTMLNAAGYRETGRLKDSETAKNLHGSGALVRDEAFDGEHYLAGYRLISDPEIESELYVMVALPGRSLSTTDRMLLKYLSYVTVIAIMLALLLALFFSRSIVNPLRLFCSAAHTIAEGSFDYRITLEREDEIGRLVESFNQMAGKLQRSYSDLERKIFEITTLYRISNLAGYESNSETLLSRMLDEIRAALESERASIFLLNQQTDTLELRMISGVPDGSAQQRVFLHTGEGIAGTVLKTGEGFINNAGESHPLFVRFREDGRLNGIQSMMCVPLSFRDRIFGVLNIVNKAQNGHYNENDFNLFKALASRLAVNLENTRLYELSITDGLTKLYVHRYFQVRLEEEIVRARRYDNQVSLLMFDIDHFKLFNDKYGHQTGDLVLMEVSEVVRHTVRRDIDIPARYGGEEFAVVFPEMGVEDALKLAERLRKKIEETKMETTNYGTLKVTVSIGVAGFPGHAGNKADLILQADTALYAAKAGGRNRVVCAGSDPPKGSY